ncbi:MAG: M50 family metallopeptidase [Myxococcota bacterium]
MGQRARRVLLISVLLTVAVYFLPFARILSYPFVLLSTLVHEMGHGITAAILGGQFHAFHMWADGSGVAQFSGIANRVARAAVAAGGLVGPAVGAAILFTIGKSSAVARVSLVFMFILLLLAEFTVVQGAFTHAFVICLMAVIALAAWMKRSWVPQFTVIFLAVQLSLSVFSRSDYLFTPVAHTSRGIMPSDVALMARALILPYWFWGGVCALFSLVVLWMGLRRLMRA